MFSSVTVFCGSKSGINPLFIEQATALGCLLAKHSVTLVYGGGRVGMMGAVADACMQNGGNVVGVIPEVLVEWEQQHKGITELRVVADMHVRKKMLYELGEAAIILPGGNGTLDELFEMVTWNTLKIHEKKIFILNTNGYYNNLIAHLDAMQTNGFLYEDWCERITVINVPDEMFE
jgi:uncharacterized protein (TIGR00730 family)